MKKSLLVFVLMFVALGVYVFVTPTPKTHTHVIIEDKIDTTMSATRGVSELPSNQPLN